MNHKQYQEFLYIAQQCESGEFRSINVGSKVRSDAIVAVWQELKWVRLLLREAVILFEYTNECNDPSAQAWWNE